MNATNIEWQKAKAEQLLRSQVEQIAKSDYPSVDLSEGMLEMSYALGLTDDARHAYWHQAIGLAVMARRQELNNLKCRALFDAPVIAGGELIAGGMHENG